MCISTAAASNCRGQCIAPQANNRDEQWRVSKAFGRNKPYDAVRVSMITRASNHTSDGWDYSTRFKWGWTDNFLHSSLVQASGGSPFTFTAGDKSTTLLVPKQGAGVSAVLTADSCIQYGGPVVL